MADTLSPSTPAPAEAIAVLRKFLDASIRRDVEAMQTCLSRATLESGNFSGAGQEGVRYELGEAAPEGTAWVVPVHAVPTDAPPGTAPAMTLPAILILEGGAWKFDLMASMDRLMGGSMQAAVEQVGKAMGEAMGQAMEGLGQAMSAAFGESGDAAGKNWLEAETEYAQEELWALPPLAPLPKLESALSAICRHPVTAGVALGDLLRQVGSDDADTLMNWFEESIFPGWVSMVALLAQRYPVIRRLHAFRLEAAKEVEQRMLILDGSDLVYRMYINNPAGYYSDAEVNDILPGVLAALPENPDASLRDFRSIHTDDELADMAAFKAHTVPRWMRRICELLGKNIRLEANWDDVYNASSDTRQLVRWSLNRIYGALCLACLDPRRKEELCAAMTGIKIVLVGNIGERAAEFADGVLTVGLNYFPGETGCFYEKDLDRVLAGEVIKHVDPEAEKEVAASAASGDDEEEGEDEEDETDEEADEDDVEDADEDDTDEEEEQDDLPVLDESERAKALNDTNFRLAAASLKENEPMWATQLAYVFGHPAALELNFDSLDGDFSLVQPFMHQGLTAVMQALPTAAMDGSLKPEIVKACQKVTISGSRGGVFRVAFADGVLLVHVPLKTGDVPPRVGEVTAALKGLTGEGTVLVAPQPVERQEATAAKVAAGDCYAQAAEFMGKLEAALKANKLWPGEKPAGEIEVRGAFGSENMAFTQWLAWVLMPRVQEIIDQQGRFPPQSQIAAYAVREFDGVPEAAEVIDVLMAFDAMINGGG